MSTFVTLGVLRRKTCEIPQNASKGANEAYTLTTRQRFLCRFATRPVSIGGEGSPYPAPQLWRALIQIYPLGFLPFVTIF